LTSIGPSQTGVESGPVTRLPQQALVRWARRRRQIAIGGHTRTHICHPDRERGISPMVIDHANQDRFQLPSCEIPRRSEPDWRFSRLGM